MRTLPLFLALAVLAYAPLSAWGRKGHRILASLALQDLPPGPAAWFQGFEETMTGHSSDPDEWKHDHLEGPRHYLNMDRYGDGVPTLISEARAKVGPQVFQRAGQLPWVIQDRVALLAKAFQAGDRQEVVLQASYLSHYVGDAHVPLHTVSAYDGQDTGQRGVHSRWETGLVDHMTSPAVGRPAALEANTIQAPWQWLKASNALVPLVLEDDRVSKQASEAPGSSVATYWVSFNQRQGPIVKEQLSRAGQHTAQLILLAWTMAGQPPAPKP